MLPRFLIADNSQELPETIFVIHTEEPRFIVESDIEDFNLSQTVHWIDEKPKKDSLIEDLLADAENFLNAELESQEDLFDESEDL